MLTMISINTNNFANHSERYISLSKGAYQKAIMELLATHSFHYGKFHSRRCNLAEEDHLLSLIEIQASDRNTNLHLVFHYMPIYFQKKY